MGVFKDQPMYADLIFQEKAHQFVCNTYGYSKQFPKNEGSIAGQLLL